jgi:uncharacterized protein (TIGR03435 family)
MSALMAFLVATLDSLWQAALLVALAWLVLKFAPGMNAATRFAIWWAVLAIVLSLPAGPRIIGSVREWLKPATMQAASPRYAPPRAAAPMIELPPLPTVEQRRDRGWPVWVAAAWALIALYRLAQLARSFVHLRGVKRRASVSDERLPPMRRSARLLVSAEIDSPIAVGFIRPAVILPASLRGELSREEMDHVLLHETAHLARWDDWTNLFGRILGAVLAPHPVAAWVLRRIAVERELACDDWVVVHAQSIRPYAKSLARLYELRFFHQQFRQEQLLSTGIFSQGSRLADRIEMLLARGREFTARVSLARLGASCAGLLALAAIASFSPRWIAFAQPPKPAFDVASIKRHKDEGGGLTFAARPGGRLTVVNNEVSNLIQNAYGIANYQLIGAPDWVNSERYDIEARGAETASQKDMMLMVQTLLTDRFAMKAHFETREMAAYILTVANGGAKLRILSPEDCVPIDTTKSDALAAPNICGNNHLARNNVWRATHTSMPGVTAVVSIVLRAPVIDRTGIKGTFDVGLQWSDDLALPDNPDAPPPFSTSLRETLGLELKSGRGPVEVLVIDHIARPTAN